MFSLMLLNGGIGSRVGAKMPKQLIRLNQIPMFIYTLRVADQISSISEIVLNYPEGWEEQIREIAQKYAIQKPLKFVPAGATRQDSVALMLKEISTPNVLVHEAARPLASLRDFNALIDHPEDNVGLTLPVPFTVLVCDPASDANKISGLLDRDTLLNIQLPQKFKTSDLQQAHDLAQKNNKTYTEDAAMVFAAGLDVYFEDGSEKNFKITTLQDVRMAEFVTHGIKEVFSDEQ